ncbi:MAG: peptide chain release factor N(5)-glutamine methyltransferase [Burkholderiaceae bacterium]
MPTDTAAATTFDALIATSGLPRVEARALLEHATRQSREFLVAHGTEPCPPAAAARFRRLVVDRSAGRPLAYLVGEREFHGRRFGIDRHVLIPRPETEGLVDEALASIAAIADPAVLDLGTGSGIIAICIALARPDAAIVATDRSARALARARRNADEHGVRIAFRQGDWWQALAGRPPKPFDAGFDLVVSNPPYIAAADRHLVEGDLRFEPRAALSPGPSGTEAIERIAAGAPGRLRRGGWLALEHGHDQAGAVVAILASAGFEAVVTRQDLAGLDRVTVGRLA